MRAVCKKISRLPQDIPSPQLMRAAKKIGQRRRQAGRRHKSSARPSSPSSCQATSKKIRRQHASSKTKRVRRVRMRVVCFGQVRLQRHRASEHRGRSSRVPRPLAARKQQKGASPPLAAAALSPSPPRMFPPEKHVCCKCPADLSSGRGNLGRPTLSHGGARNTAHADGRQAPAKTLIHKGRGRHAARRVTRGTQTPRSPQPRKARNSGAFTRRASMSFRFYNHRARKKLGRGRQCSDKPARGRPPPRSRGQTSQKVCRSCAPEIGSRSPLSK